MKNISLLFLAILLFASKGLADEPFQVEIYRNGTFKGYLQDSGNRLWDFHELKIADTPDIPGAVFQFSIYCAPDVRSRRIDGWYGPSFDIASPKSVMLIRILPLQVYAITKMFDVKNVSCVLSILKMVKTKTVLKSFIIESLYLSPIETMTTKIRETELNENSDVISEFSFKDIRNRPSILSEYYGSILFCEENEIAISGQVVGRKLIPHSALFSLFPTKERIRDERLCRLFGLGLVNSNWMVKASPPFFISDFGK